MFVRLISKLEIEISFVGFKRGWITRHRQESQLSWRLLLFWSLLPVRERTAFLDKTCFEKTTSFKSEYILSHQVEAPKLRLGKFMTKFLWTKPRKRQVLEPLQSELSPFPHGTGTKLRKCLTVIFNQSGMSELSFTSTLLSPLQPVLLPTPIALSVLSFFCLLARAPDFFPPDNSSVFFVRR